MGTKATAGRKFGGKTGEERRAERRALLIQSAIQTYGARGYRNTTVKTVCDVAALTERYFYESFAKSEDLLFACFQQVTGEILAAMRKAGAIGFTPMDRVRSGLLVYLKSLQDNPAAARVFLIEMASVSPEADVIVSASLDDFGALLVDFLKEDPDFDSGYSPLLLRGAIGGGLHIAQDWIASGYAEDVEVVADIALRLYGLVAKR